MSKPFRIIIYCSLFILLFTTLGSVSRNPFPAIILIMVATIFVTEKITKKQQEVLKNPTKLCRYCKKEIDSYATVCPICRRGLTFGTNTGVLVVLLIIIAFFIWGIFSNNAPEFVRETVCGLGIRDDFPYCYKIN